MGGKEGKKKKKKKNPSTPVFKTLPEKLMGGKKKEQRGSLRRGEFIKQVIKSAEKTSHVSSRSLNQHSGKEQYFQTF